MLPKQMKIYWCEIHKTKMEPGKYSTLLYSPEVASIFGRRPEPTRLSCYRCTTPGCRLHFEPFGFGHFMMNDQNKANPLDGGPRCELEGEHMGLIQVDAQLYWGCPIETCTFSKRFEGPKI